MTFLKSPRTQAVDPGGHIHPVMAGFTWAVREQRVLEEIKTVHVNVLGCISGLLRKARTWEPNVRACSPLSGVDSFSGVRSQLQLRVRRSVSWAHLPTGSRREGCRSGGVSGGNGPYAHCALGSPSRTNPLPTSGWGKMVLADPRWGEEGT